MTAPGIVVPVIPAPPFWGAALCCRLIPLLLTGERTLQRVLRAILRPTVSLPGAGLFELAGVIDLEAMGETPGTPSILPKLEPREAKVRIVYRDQGETMLIYSEGFV